MNMQCTGKQSKKQKQKKNARRQDSSKVIQTENTTPPSREVPLIPESTTPPSREVPLIPESTAPPSREIFLIPEVDLPVMESQPTSAKNTTLDPEIKRAIQDLVDPIIQPFIEKLDTLILAISKLHHHLAAQAASTATNGEQKEEASTNSLPPPVPHKPTGQQLAEYNERRKASQES